MLKARVFLSAFIMAFSASTLACQQAAGAANGSDSICAENNSNNQYVDEAVERQNIKQSVLDLYLKKNWQALDKREKEFIAGFPATHSGTQKLVLFYTAFTGTFGDDSQFLNSIADEWLASQPSSPAAHIVKAMAMDAKALALRGEGDISSVDPSKLPDIQRLFEEEKAYLLKIKSVADRDPVWYQQMEVVARYLGDTALLNKTLEEGSNKFPDYQNLYLEAVIMALPKWGGDPQDIEKIARLAVSRTKKVSGYSLYAYLWHNAFIQQPELMMLLDENKILAWDDLKQGWQDRYKQYPTNNTVTKMMSHACVAKDKNAFQQAYKLVGDDYGELQQKGWLSGTNYHDCVAYLK
ncbi:DUF4034 domain-containing protein [Huaxiibacter chinensis]|uniref:DUF4034 domain-containing protein n=1 Tax=Huaxiibacter chinensis TaxID=2899785 RepID=UPI003D311C92